MTKLSLRRARFRKGKGFSLVVVLIICLIGLGIVGAAMQFTAAAGGSGRVASSLTAKYNILQDAVEEGRALLKESMDHDGEPHRYFHKRGIAVDTSITESSILLLTDSPTGYPGVDFPLGNAITRDINKRDLGRLGVFGDSGLITVRIYDMQYDPKLVPSVGTGPNQISPEELQQLPPHIQLLGADDSKTYITTDGPDKERNPLMGDGSGYAGVYLIRATLSVMSAGGSPVQSWSVETSVIQANMQ
ncbi:MAG: hypothetical protein LBL05_05365 [Synergistaceae bacterium]|jgi:hypothetical protein|nr:hypothetical protein [Synergistaceae bacterium]